MRHRSKLEQFLLYIYICVYQTTSGGMGDISAPQWNTGVAVGCAIGHVCIYQGSVSAFFQRFAFTLSVLSSVVGASLPSIFRAPEATCMRDVPLESRGMLRTGAML